MKKKVKKLFITSSIILIIEILILGALFTVYMIDFFDVQKYIEWPWVIVAFFAFVFVNIIYLFSVCFYVLKKGNDVDADITDIIGTDLQDAYLFGKIGFLIVNINGTIIYASELFREIEKEMIGLNIYEWDEKLRDFIDKDEKKTIKISKQGAIYSVKYLRSAGVFIFKDDTEIENLSKAVVDRATCIGFINIDNYNEIISINEDNNDSIVKAKSEIAEYAKEFGILLRSLKSDSYIAVCSYSSLEKVMKDKFSLLDKVRNMEYRDDIKPTLSIGFACSFPDVNKLNEMASNAISLAMSRGGDQAVVAKYNNEIEFFGGKTEAVENVNKVKIRVFSDSLISLIKRSTNVFIMGHRDLDMDALGSCLGAKALCDFCEKPAFIIYDHKLTERKTRVAASSMFMREEFQKTFISPKEACDKTKAGTLVIVVDTSKPSLVMCSDILDLVDKVVVIDHHRRAEEFIDHPVLNYIDTSSSSASELLAESLKYHTERAKIPLDPKYATIMLSGIFLDTGFYKAKTVGLRTFEASMILKEYGADNAKADDLLKDEYEEYTLINKIVDTMKAQSYGVVYCKCPEEDEFEKSTLAKVANTCMQLKGVNSCFVIGRTDDNGVSISARSDGTINVQILCEKMGGGGHFSQAGCYFKEKTVKQVEEILLENLTNNLSSARDIKEKGEDK